MLCLAQARHGGPVPHLPTSLLSCLLSCTWSCPDQANGFYHYAFYKDTKGDINDKDNDRPIAITCCSSKVVESIHRYNHCLTTPDHQLSPLICVHLF